MNENKNEKTLVDKLIALLKRVIDAKGACRSAKKALRNCSRKERRALRYDSAAAAAENKAREAAAALDAAKAAGDTKAAEEAAIAVETANGACKTANEKAAGIRSREEKACRETLSKLRIERDKLIAEVPALISKIGGYKRRDRKEIARLLKLAGL